MESLVCKEFCSFYKPGKEEMQCGSMRFLNKHMTPHELQLAARFAPKKFDRSTDDSIRELVCAKCDFLVDGCDFRDGLDSPPCGGYPVVEHLLKQSH